MKIESGAQDAGHALSTGDKLLHGQYTIQCYLSSGGFGVTYLARDSLDRRLVIKECFPVLTCHRKGKRVMGRTAEDEATFKTIVRNLMHEARRMARLDHPNIVGVHQVFEENGTAYMALDFVNGLDLLDIIQHDPRRLTPEVVKSIVKKTLEAVVYMHDSDMLHRDISPDNILITEDNEPVLIDFGAAREVTNKASRAMSTIDSVKEGYSPLEFYSKGAEQTHASDIYSLGASFYHVLTGVAPPDSLTRLSAVAGDEVDPLEPISMDIPGYDRFFLSAIDRAMALFPKDRPQSTRVWLEQVDEVRRQKALVAAAQQDEGLEDIIKDLIDKSNSDLSTAQAVRQAESARRERIAAHSQRLLDKIPEPRTATHDIFGDALDDDSADVTLPIISPEKLKKRSLFGGVMLLSSSFFSSKKSSVEAES
ncbi:MAG: serine/threonine-protein kinase [Pseudomonadota bacterium]